MEEKKNLCAPIPLSLYQRLRTEQEQRGPDPVRLHHGHTQRTF